MIKFARDQDVDPLRPEASLEDLVVLLHLFAGRKWESLDRGRLKTQVNSLISLGMPDPPHNLTLSPGQINHLLVNVDEDIVSEAFLHFFARHAIAMAGQSDPAEQSISLTLLKSMATCVRGFAILKFGDFRFGFRTLSNASSSQELADALAPWSDDTEQLRSALTSRQALPPSLQPSLIARSHTSALGYVSYQQLIGDIAIVMCIWGKSGMLSLDQVLSHDIARGDDIITTQIRATWDPLVPEVVERHAQRRDALLAAAIAMYGTVREDRDRGFYNTTKYLTSDAIDVYVATSMRNVWEFAETFDLVSRLVVELRDLNLRWFDPTQSYDPSPIDKGLTEALMLRRCKLTVYMAQETDTLGKDSELAATLAQGKPVVVYIKSANTPGALREFAERLQHDHPPAYFRKRLLNMMAEEFLTNPAQLAKIEDRANSIGVELADTDVEEVLNSMLQESVAHEKGQTFRFLESDAQAFGQAISAKWPNAWRIFAAAESVFLDNRAKTMSSFHPLAYQVHLESGVANGVFLTRSVEACSELIRGLLTNDITFGIEHIAGRTPGTRTATLLVHEGTKSRFRVISGSRVLSNAFWAYYP